jgi:rRNA processing protein Krr1/Pno1
MVSADVKQLGIVAGVAVAAGGVAFKSGMNSDFSIAASMAIFLLFIAVTQYNKQQKPTGFAAAAKSAVADADFDDEAEEAEATPKVVKQNKNSKRLARKAKAKAERKKNGPSEAELQRERERAAKEKAARLAKAKANEPESETSKKNKKKQKAKERKKQLEQMKEHQKEVDAGEWEVQASTRPTKTARAAEDEVDEDGEPIKKKVVAEATVYEEVDPKFYGRIIGSAGATLNALQDGTGTEINVPRRDANHRMVTIVGSKEGTKLAQQYIKELVSKGYCKLTDPDMTSTVVKVPGKQHMAIVGTGGATIRTLQTATNTRINLPSRESKSEEIEVLGAAQDVAQAVAAIRELVQDGFSSITHEGWIKYPVAVDPVHFRTIIGKGGATIKSIQSTSGCKVNIPQASSVDQKVYICGPLNGVDHAEQLMRKAIAENEAKELAYQQSQIIELDTTGVWAERNYHESDLWN